METTIESDAKGHFLGILSGPVVIVLLLVLGSSILWGRPQQLLIGEGASGQQLGQIPPQEIIVGRNFLGAAILFLGVFFAFSLFGGRSGYKAGYALILTTLVAAATLCGLQPLLQVAVALPGATANATQVIGESGEYIPPILSLGALILGGSILLHFAKFLLFVRR